MQIQIINEGSFKLNANRVSRVFQAIRRLGASGC